MKLVRFGPAGHEKPGLIDTNGLLRDLSGIISDITAQVLDREGRARLQQINPETLPVVRSPVRFGVPVAHTGKFIGIGLNYRDHAIEANMPIPDEPIIFMKATSCLCGPNDDIIKPVNAIKMDWEVELGIVIGERARKVGVDQALDHVAGYCVVNDVSERHFQIERGGTWDKGKGFDTFGPVGPWLVTPDEIPDVQNLDLWLDRNGQRMQTGCTSTMIFSCAELISYLSQVMTLLPGDIITTGTPPGVGMGMKPPAYLQVGDTLTLGIQGLGAQHQTVIHDT